MYLFRILTVSVHISVYLLVVAGEHVNEGLPKVVAEDDVYDRIEHGVRVRHEFNPELVWSQPAGQLKKEILKIIFFFPLKLKKNSSFSMLTFFQFSFLCCFFLSYTLFYFRFPNLLFSSQILQVFPFIFFPFFSIFSFLFIFHPLCPVFLCFLYFLDLPPFISYSLCYFFILLILIIPNGNPFPMIGFPSYSSKFYVIYCFFSAS